MANSILIVDDEQHIRESLALLLQDSGYAVHTAESGEAALEYLAKRDVDLMLCDIRMSGMDGMELMRRVRGNYPQTPVMIMTAYASIETAIEALRRGAADYVIKPVDFDELKTRIRNILRFRSTMRENAVLRKRLGDEAGFDAIIGRSPAMQRVFELIRKVAASRTNVLITGQSGAGKELAAKAIHYNSERRDRIFLPINCGAISETLIESELFGHKRGAFTDAYQDKPGVFQLADGGTLFLDEVGEIPLHLQVKLLRALDEREVTPVGGSGPVSVDVRILSATNQDLKARVVSGGFREDLYYRLNVVEIRLPPLSDRRDDIPLLVEHFVGRYADEMGKCVTGVDNDTMRALMSHEWRGGVRELENVIERAVIFCDGPTITLDELPWEAHPSPEDAQAPDVLREAMRLHERRHIVSILQRTDGNKEQAARLLNVGLSSLYRKIEDLGIRPEESRRS